MSAKEELRQILLDEAKINYKLEELVRLRSMATKVTSAMSDDVVSRSRYPYTMENAVDKIIHAQEELNGMIDALIEKKHYFSSIIDSMDNPAHIQVLTGRYYDGKTLERLSTEMGYSYRHICNIHGDALAAVDAKMKEKAKRLQTIS